MKWPAPAAVHPPSARSGFSQRRWCCARARQSRLDGPATPRLTLEEATELVPPKVPDREGWALDVLTALGAHQLHPDAQAICSVLAVVEQESGYKANPEVAGLAKIVRDRLESYAGKLGPLGRRAMDNLLEGRAEGTKLTFDERLQKARTERDLDLLFRDTLRYYESAFPTTYKLLDLGHAISGRGSLEALNPITTATIFIRALTPAGSMDTSGSRGRIFSSRLLGQQLSGVIT